MKKKFFYAGMMAVSIIATATSCSKNEDLSAGNNDSLIATGEQIITLDLQDTDVLASRSRPLYSTTNKGAEDVTDVKLFVFEHLDAESSGSTARMQIVNVLTVPNWNDNSTSYDFGQKHTLKLEGDDKLEKNKTYTILAVGQNEGTTENHESTPYNIIAGNLSATTIKKGLNWTVNKTNDLTGATWNASSIAGEGFLKTEAKEERISEAEIFSGISKPVTLSIESNGGFTVNVLMKRQVAGVIGYFYKIPAIVEKEDVITGNWYTKYDAVKKIRLVAHNKNTQIDLTYDLGKQKDDATNTGDEFIVNGFTKGEPDAKFENPEEDAYTVYEIDLSNWFDVANPKANDASYWYDESQYETLYFKDGLPTLGNDMNYATTDPEISTLPEDENPYTETLATPEWNNYYDIANDNPRVYTGSVLAGEFVIPFYKISNGNNNTFELQLLGGADNKILKSWNVKLDEASIDEERGDSNYKFSVYRNHLYQIGTRGSDSPDKPGTGTDNPQALDKDQELVIKINDQWEFIHDMEIE